MLQPRLLLNIFDREMKQLLLNDDSVRRFNITHVGEGESWVDQLSRIDHDVAIVQVADIVEADFQQLLAEHVPGKTEVILISNGEPNEHIDRAMRRGVSYHLRAPINMAFVKELMQELYAEMAQRDEVAEKTVCSNLDQFGLLVGSSPVMRKLYRVIRKAADSETTVLIFGESGSGKELVANTIHLMSNRAERPFIALNCGALSPELVESELFGHIKGAFTGANKDRAGVFEQARGGTLFLDEITEMSPEHQVKLLRVLENGEYRPLGSDKANYADVRIIAATNNDPSESIRQDRFREDLYFRLAEFPIRVPPLRSRGSDIIGLSKHFLAYRNSKEKTSKEISAEALDKIESYNWPGNVRELKHAIERAYILADDILKAEHVILEDPGASSESAPKAQVLPSGLTLGEMEKGMIIKTLAENGGNKSETAAQLGISVKTLYNKLEKYEQSRKGATWSANNKEASS